MKQILISRSNNWPGGDFGFTLRHLVVYPSKIPINDILQASYTVVIDEHQQKQLDEKREETISAIIPSSFAENQGEQQGLSSSNSMKIIIGDNIDGDGTTIRNNYDENLQSMDTIFVKDVRFNSPAYRAGLRQGDRILSINNQSVENKTYSQVINTIQNIPTDLILNVISKDDDNISLNSNQSSLLLNRSLSYRLSNKTMSKKTIEQKLRNLQINLAQGRTQEELAQAGIYFPSPTLSKNQNIFSNYIDSVHKALDSTKADSTVHFHQSPYHNEYVPYDYKQDTSSSYIPTVNSSCSLASEQDKQHWKLESPSIGSTVNEKSSVNENDMKTEFVDYRRKQFETGHVENLVHDKQRDSKTKKYSEKKKYENEWNRLTASADVESVMERASHFEDIDPDKFARLKSKLPNSSSLQDNLTLQNDYLNDIDLNQYIFYDSQVQAPYKLHKPLSLTFTNSSTYSIPKANEINTVEYNYDSRYLIPTTNENQLEMTSRLPSNYLPLKSNERYLLENYPTQTSSRIPGVNLIRQDSYITAVRSTYTADKTDFVKMHASNQFDLSFYPETPVLRRKTTKYGLTPEQDTKQRRTSYLIATDQQVTNRDSFTSLDFLETDKNENYSYDVRQGQIPKLRHTIQYQTPAIKKLKNFFGESTPEVSHALDHRSSLLSDNQSKSSSSSSYYHNRRDTIPLKTMPDNIEATKEGILYCKTVSKEGRRAPDRSWRGAWAVLRRGALFLGKEKKHGLLIPLSCDSFPINLHDAEVELASDYVKKPRVFKLTTSNHSEFLFQAPDIQSLEEWLDVINENCFTTTNQPDNQQKIIINKKEKFQRKSTTSLTSMTNNDRPISQQDLTLRNDDERKSSPSLKRSPSIRFRKSQKSSLTQPIAQLSGFNSPSNVSPRRSFVKSIVKKGLRTLKSSSSLLTNQMSGQIYDESSGESLSSTTGNSNNCQGINFGIELEECESSSLSRFIPIVVEILTCLVELRGINYQGIYRHAGGLTAVNWLVNEFNKGAERIEFNSDKWYDVKAVASTLKTFFAKLPDSLLSSKMSSLCVESSRIETHRNRLIELKRLINQLDDYRYETLKYLCAHFRRVASKCDINKIDARNLAIIFGPTLIWDSKASLQSNLVDNPEKIRIIESLILYYEWFFDQDDYDRIPIEIKPQMPKLSPITNISHLESERLINNESQPSEIIQHIVRAAKRRWSSPLLVDSLSSISTTTTDQQTSKPINISVKRNNRRDKKEEKSSRCHSVDSSLNVKQQTNQIVSSSTDSAVYSMSDISSSTSTTIKKPSQSLKDISHFLQYFNLSNEKTKSKTLTNMRRKKLRKKLTKETFVAPLIHKDDDIYERMSNSSIGFIDQSPTEDFDFVHQTSLLKSKLIEHGNTLETLKQQMYQVDKQLLNIHDNSLKFNRQLIKRRHTFNSVFDLNCLFIEKSKSSFSSLFALQLL